MRVAAFALLVGLAVSTGLASQPREVRAGDGGRSAERGVERRAEGGAESAIEVRDDTGRSVSLDRIPGRIVALAPSATALLFAAGAGDRIVATIEYSDDPPAARRIPRIGDALAIDLEQLLALRPDVVVVSEGITSPLQIERVASLGLPVYRTRAESLDGLARSIRHLGRLTATSEAAELAAREIERKLATLRARYASRPRLRVLYQVWDRPVYTIGSDHVISHALELCGGINVFGDQRVAAPAISTESVIARNPEVIIGTAPDDDARAWLDRWRRFPSLQAVRDDRLLVFNDMRLDRMGPSAVDAAATLCELLDTAR